MLAGSALLIDYVLTITISLASGADAICSFLPPPWNEWKLSVRVRRARHPARPEPARRQGIGHDDRAGLRAVPRDARVHVRRDDRRATSGDFGDETRPGHGRASRRSVVDARHRGACSTSSPAPTRSAAARTPGSRPSRTRVALMREPKVAHREEDDGDDGASRSPSPRPRSSWATSSSTRARGRQDDERGALRARRRVLDARRASRSAHVLVVITLISEAALLLIAAQAGFIGGPRVMANMAADSWFPHRLSALSDRLTMRNGVLLMGRRRGPRALLRRRDRSRSSSSCTRSTCS